LCFCRFLGGRVGNEDIVVGVKGDWLTAFVIGVNSVPIVRQAAEGGEGALVVPSSNSLPTSQPLEAVGAGATAANLAVMYCSSRCTSTGDKGMP